MDYDMYIVLLDLFVLEDRLADNIFINSVALIEHTWPVQDHRFQSAVAVHGVENILFTGKLTSRCRSD